MSGSGPRLLFVGTDTPWSVAAAEAARRLGASMDTQPDPRAALSWVLQPGRVYDHVLVVAPARSRAIDALAGVLDEATQHPTAMVLLGGVGADTAMRRVRAPNVKDILAALTAPDSASDAAKPPIDGDELAGALHDGALRIRFQPILRASDLEPIGLEALARLHHGSRGIVHPRDFIPLTIASGRERVLTAIVAARAFMDIGACLQGTELFLAMNIPLSTVAQPSAMRRGLELCGLAHIPVERIIIEVLETRTAPDLKALCQSLRDWHAAGFRTAIDDAGPALPHWQDLLDLPFDVLKLDGSMVADPAQHDLLSRIVAEGRKRGRFLIAEGIEDRPCLERVQALGVDAVQGFLFSRPLPALAVPVWLGQWEALRAAA
jgi:EAL domain-containing protein (putative c-di-GMP-specific phosphodiesterase class I)